MNSDQSYWVHDLNPVIFQLTDTLAVRWYGVAYLAAFFSAYLLLRLYWVKKRSVIEPRMFESFFTWVILGVIVGGRVGYMLLYDLGDFLRNPLILFQFWEGGMASHGGFVGVALGTFIFAKKWKIPLLKVWDICATLTPGGLMLGRLANFVNGELYGKVSSVSWAVIFPSSAPYGKPVELIEPRHPSQLYQAGLEGLLLFLYIQHRFWRSPIERPAGKICGEFLIGYAVLRTIGEIFREPDAALIFGLSRGTFYSISLFLIGGAMLVFALRSKNSSCN